MKKIKQILEKSTEDTVQEVFTALEVPQLRENEVDFVKEYCSVMQPLAVALDMLQAENKCYIGFLLPTLTSLECKLRAPKPNVKLTGPLIDAILSALGTRFAGYGDRSELIIASVTLPQFTLRWLDDAKKAAVRSLMYEYATAVQQQTATTSQDTDNVCESASQEVTSSVLRHSPQKTQMLEQKLTCS